MRRQIIKMNYLLIFVVVSLAGVMWHFDARQKNKVLSKFTNRELISPVEQLSKYFGDHQTMDIAVGLWNELARAYGILPFQLRSEDKLEEIISSDFFGDNGLALEKEFTQRGIVGKLEKLTVLELTTLYVSRVKK